MVSIFYFDTSALLKQYVAEIGSGWVNDLLATSPAPFVFTSQLTTVEGVCAFTRRLREGTLSSVAHSRLLAAFDYDMTYRYQLVDIMPATIETARQLAQKHPLRAYDAIQLATAWLVNQTLVGAEKAPLLFISADDRLNGIAQVEGLEVDNPNHHA